MYSIGGDWDAESLALHVQAVLQGAFILAKAKGGAEAAIKSLDHLRRYLELLFASPKTNLRKRHIRAIEAQPVGGFHNRKG